MNMATLKKAFLCQCILLCISFSEVFTRHMSCTEVQVHPNSGYLEDSTVECGLRGRPFSPPWANISNRIMGGSRATLREHPWMAIPIYKCTNSTNKEDTLKCDGFLVTDRHVLTAAHCCIIPNCTIVGVRLGEYDVEEDTDCFQGECAPPPIDVPVKKVVSHRQFRHGTAKHDICLLRLSTNIINSIYMNPVCLPTPCKWGEPSYGGANLMVAGWGMEQLEPRPHRHPVLQRLTVPVIPAPVCAAFWHVKGVTIEDDLQICAGMTPGRAICHGDSGGPLMHMSGDRVVAVGVLALSEKCSYKNKIQNPAVSTRIAEYLLWILDSM